MHNEGAYFAMKKTYDAVYRKEDTALAHITGYVRLSSPFLRMAWTCLKAAVFTKYFSVELKNL